MGYPAEMTRLQQQERTARTWMLRVQRPKVRQAAEELDTVCTDTTSKLWEQQRQVDSQQGSSKSVEERLRHQQLSTSDLGQS